MSDGANNVSNEMTASQEAEALHGLAENPATPLVDRIGLALKGLDRYAYEVDRLTKELEEARAEREDAEKDWNRFAVAEARRADIATNTLNQVRALLDASHNEGRTYIRMADIRGALDILVEGKPA